MIFSRGNVKRAYFSGGCFWCMEHAFEAHKGVVDAVSGYSGGNEQHPTYKEVVAGLTGHRETIEVHYNPDAIDYKTLLYIFWRNIDPTDGGGQFVDRGEQYTTAVFYNNDDEKTMAEETKQELIDAKVFAKDIMTEVLPFRNFYKAEHYHQSYYKNYATRYKFYTIASGRPQFAMRFWKDGMKDAGAFLNAQEEAELV